jgi:glycosyltransferase involved in cell wall biosynthesis
MVASDHDLTLPAAESRRVAICIPAFGDPAGLEATLRSVRAVDHPRRLLQVIVVVDGPDEALATVARGGGADDVVVLERNQGSYAARNAAVAAIRPDVDAVLFTDSDAEVDPHWVRAHLDALRASPRSGGRVVFRTSSPPTPAEVVDARRHLNQEHYVGLGYAATVNLGVRPEVLAAIRFDATLRSGGDFEFGQRATAAGFAIAWTPDAIVFHGARPSARQLLRKVDRVGRGARVMQASGHAATGRRLVRAPLRNVARTSVGFEPGAWWMLRAKVIDALCSLTFARHVPAVVLPAVRRRLTTLARGA